VLKKASSDEIQKTFITTRGKDRMNQSEEIGKISPEKKTTMGTIMKECANTKRYLNIIRSK
jgi:hypothetical protein